MGRRTWPEPNENDRMVSRIGIELQAEANGVDLTEPGMKAFIENMIEVKSEMMAENRFLQNILHKRDFSNDG